MRRELGFWILYIRLSMGPNGRQVGYIYYKDESRLISNDIIVITSCIDECGPKENRILFLCD